jgi:hypothetical protein
MLFLLTSHTLSLLTRILALMMIDGWPCKQRREQFADIKIFTHIHTHSQSVFHESFQAPSSSIVLSARVSVSNSRKHQSALLFLPDFTHTQFISQFNNTSNAISFLLVRILRSSEKFSLSLFALLSLARSRLLALSRGEEN